MKPCTAKSRLHTGSTRYWYWQYKLQSCLDRTSYIRENDRGALQAGCWGGEGEQYSFLVDDGITEGSEEPEGPEGPEESEGSEQGLHADRVLRTTTFDERILLSAVLSMTSTTRIKPSVKSPKSGILVTEVMTFDKIAPWVILGRS